MRSVRHRVQDMLQAISNIERYAVRGKYQFETDELLQGYVVYQLMILDEAAYNMPENVQEHYSEVPWKKISGMRHVLVHGYFSIDLDIVWAVIARDLPMLRERLQGILNEKEL